MRANDVRWGTAAGLGVLLCGLLTISGCNGCSSSSPAPIVDMNNQPDPAAGNMAPVSGTSSSTPTSAVMGQQMQGPTQANGEQYPEGGAPPAQGQENAQQSGYSYNDPDYEQSQVDTGMDALYAPQPPPPLPVYEQPELTEPGFLWTPGYWAYSPSGYYWVPGAWVAPPYENALWTPGYWGYDGGRYYFHGGYWGQHIGFYGGISYGFGYNGHGYEGGYWNGGHFFYNQQVNRVNVSDVRNVYARNVTAVNNRDSFNGPHGITARPMPAEMAALHEKRTPPMAVQTQQVRAAQSNRGQFFSDNHGKPAVAVAATHFAADRTPPAAIRQTNAPGGRGGVNPQANQPQVRAQQEQQQRGQEQMQQRNQGAAERQPQQNAEQQRNVQAQQQRTVQQQPQRAVQPQRAQPQVQPQERPQPQQQRVQPQPQQQRVQSQPQQQRVQPQPQQQRPVEQPRPAAQPERAAPQPQPQRAPEPQRAAPAPRPAPAPAPHAAPPPRPAPQQHPAPAHPPAEHPKGL